MSMTRRHFVAVTGALMAARPGLAETNWPSRAVRLVAATPPAGASDILTRTLGAALQGQLGQSFVVDNRPGAGGVIGSDFVAKSAPDGYTWLTTNVGSHAINVTLNPHLPYDARNDFRNVTTIGRLPVVMLVNNDLPANSLADNVALASAKP